jgi:hypothetical protein
MTRLGFTCRSLQDAAPAAPSALTPLQNASAMLGETQPAAAAPAATNAGAAVAG